MPNFFPGSGNGGDHNGGTQSWNAGNSFLFDGGQELVKGSNMASRSLREGGWMAQAALAAEEACRLNPESDQARREKEVVDTWRARLRA